ncbi:MAG: hypothetical protein A3I66_14115 [Burkholderiales bacterium RIFCSPLOWO2_02_FULL_57_36]|nr:MAG: hypothetical protein A3I66_14115 [Burkholderiales bacterium RIFCSPLOWO2_02_FULL_57_36]
MLIKTFSPPAGLRSVFLDGMVLQFDCARYFMPVRATSVLLVHISGSTKLIQQDGTCVYYPRLSLIGPRLAPSELISEPGTLVLALPFRIGLILPTIGISPAEIIDQHMELAAVLGDQAASDITQCIDADTDIPRIIGEFQSILAAAIRCSGMDRIRQAYQDVSYKLFLPLTDFALFVGVGERQLERRVRHQVGMPLRCFRRIVRFVLTLEKLFKNTALHGDLTDIAHEFGYYDQPHMHREFIEWCGLSPIRLVKKMKEKDPAYWFYQMTADEYRRICVSLD